MTDKEVKVFKGLIDKLVEHDKVIDVIVRIKYETSIYQRNKKYAYRLCKIFDWLGVRYPSWLLRIFLNRMDNAEVAIKELAHDASNRLKRSMITKEEVEILCANLLDID